MVYRHRRSHHGVILWRLKDERTASKTATLENLLSRYSADLTDQYVVATEEHVRFARG
ncbi:MAG TPA: hypothetical protein VFD70_16420 [Anaerolineae bacterium]|nr:hypothetical protein [Anaerolineae bacterium]